ncbi:hypothetical protein SAY86_000541 [Trapa natans]|uniref:Myeloid leukemia factor 1 n=1 Tax=Trapa natans TaxID=22666 RepID=A0AAN7RN05_TRANT|nr:hypothetical protein SAY86_000541 [Trapa natans]
MQGRGGRDPFMDFPFGGFSGFGGLGSHRSLISSFFGGGDPFDDPFFTQPFGGMMGSNVFGSMPSPFMEVHPAGFIEHHPPVAKRSRGPIIEELNSDNEQEADQCGEGNPRKHPRSINGPHIDAPSEEDEGRLTSQMQSWDNYRNRLNQALSQPQGRSFTFQSSTVMYGGPNGAYYTSSTTRRTGNDGVTFEEKKEADSSTMQATHRVSRGIHNKGHSMTRKLNSEGRVETMETLHNLNQDDLMGFEEAWKGKARKHLPGWTDHASSSINHASSGSRGAWALPSTEPSSPMMMARPISNPATVPRQPQLSGKMKAETSAKGPQPRGKSRGR